MISFFRQKKAWVFINKMGSLKKSKSQINKPRPAYVLPACVYVWVCVKGTGSVLKWLRCSSLFGGHAAPSKHRAPLKQTGEDRRARLMMGSTQLSYTCMDTHTRTQMQVYTHKLARAKTRGICPRKRSGVDKPSIGGGGLKEGEFTVCVFKTPFPTSLCSHTVPSRGNTVSCSKVKLELLCQKIQMSFGIISTVFLMLCSQHNLHLCVSVRSRSARA